MGPFDYRPPLILTRLKRLPEDESAVDAHVVFCAYRTKERYIVRCWHVRFGVDPLLRPDAHEFFTLDAALDTMEQWQPRRVLIKRLDGDPPGLVCSWV